MVATRQDSRNKHVAHHDARPTRATDTTRAYTTWLSFDCKGNTNQKEAISEALLVAPIEEDTKRRNISS